MKRLSERQAWLLMARQWDKPETYEGGPESFVSCTVETDSVSGLCAHMKILYWQGVLAGSDNDGGPHCAARWRERSRPEAPRPENKEA